MTKKIPQDTKKNNELQNYQFKKKNNLTSQKNGKKIKTSKKN